MQILDMSECHPRPETLAEKNAREARLANERPETLGIVSTRAMPNQITDKRVMTVLVPKKYLHLGLEEVLALKSPGTHENTSIVLYMFNIHHDHHLQHVSECTYMIIFMIAYMSK